MIYIQENKLSAQQAVVEFGIKTPRSIVLWGKRCDEGGLTILSRKPKEQSTVPEKPDIPAPSPKNDRPFSKNRREELEYLHAENAHLKKLEALIRQQKLSARKSERK